MKLLFRKILDGHVKLRSEAFEAEKLLLSFTNTVNGKIMYTKLMEKYLNTQNYVLSFTL